MKNKRGKTCIKNTMNNIIKSLACICIALSLFAITSCDDTRGSVLMLKITTTTSYGIFPATKTNYYIVYENGAVKETSKFVLADVKSYAFAKNDTNNDSVALHLIDINTPNGKELNGVANNILLLMSETKLENMSVGRLFVLGERYLFDVGYVDDKKTGTKLFEYISADNSIKEISTLNIKGDLSHVELYESVKR